MQRFLKVSGLGLGDSSVSGKMWLASEMCVHNEMGKALFLRVAVGP